MEAKDPKSTETSKGDDGEPTSREPDSAATSDETLSDVEKEEKVTDTPGDTESIGSASAGTPSPDGAFDDNRGGDGGVGPM
jgi:hypothetical protein